MLKMTRWRWCCCALAPLLYGVFLFLSVPKWLAVPVILVICLLTLRPKSLVRGIGKRALPLSFGLIVGLFLIEGYVRVFDPFPILLRGGRINLPVNSQEQFKDHGIASLDETITVTFNSLGFRGQEPPEEFDSRLTMLCVGGSTTQCFYLSDGTTWPDLLGMTIDQEFDNFWINNAGLDGHSTFGHLHLVDQYISKLKPKVVLFLVGVNDVGRDDLTYFDRESLRDQGEAEDSVSRTIHRFLLRNSDAYALADNLRRQTRAKKQGLKHDIRMAHNGLSEVAEYVSLSHEERINLVENHSQVYLDGYRKRVTSLVRKCQAFGAEVVLVTQPTLYGEGMDDLSSVDLERVKVRYGDGWTLWRTLQKYNQITIDVGAEFDATVIQLGNQLPKSSRFYYDLIHFSPDGAEAVARIISEELVPMLQTSFPEYLRTGD